MFLLVRVCEWTCALPELSSRGGHLFLLTSSVCIITSLPGLGSRCYESAKVTNDHAIAFRTHACTDTTQPPSTSFKPPQGMWGVCVYLLSSGLARSVWPGFHLGGRSPSILLTTSQWYAAAGAGRNSAHGEDGSSSQSKQKEATQTGIQHEITQHEHKKR